MRIAMLSGSWPPDRCGVGDYTEQLSLSLEQSGIEIIRLGIGGFDVSSVASARRRMSECAADILHIQYPTIGYGRSIAPALLATFSNRRPVVATLHEFASFRAYRLPWFAPYAFKAKAIIFTNETEHDAFKRRLGRVPPHSEIIPIGSNIPIGSKQLRAPRSICYFGLLMPSKGLEQFLDLSERLLPNGFEISIIGSVPPQAEQYATVLIDRFRALGGKAFLNEQPDRVAHLLSGQTYAYLPFPDGATDKRGSLLAAIVNGVRVVAPLSVKSRPPITDYIMAAQSVEDASTLLIGLINGTRSWSGSPIDDLAARYTWASISTRHTVLYNRMLA